LLVIQGKKPIVPGLERTDFGEVALEVEEVEVVGSKLLLLLLLLLEEEEDMGVLSLTCAEAVEKTLLLSPAAAGEANRLSGRMCSILLFTTK
jgi:hypothetical protein